MEVILVQISFVVINTAIVNDVIDKEPAGILIDERLDKVKDWEIIEKESSISEIIKNSSILVKNNDTKKALTIKPKYPLYNNQFINTIRRPNR